MILTWGTKVYSLTYITEVVCTAPSTVHVHVHVYTVGSSYTPSDVEQFDRTPPPF